MSKLSEMAGDGGPLFVQEFTTSLLIAIEGEVIKVEAKWLAAHVMWLTIRIAFKAILMVTHNTSLMWISKMSNIASKLPASGAYGFRCDARVKVSVWLELVQGHL